MKGALAISADVDLTRDFVRVAFMACASLDGEDEKRPALKALLYHVEVLLTGIESDLDALAAEHREVR